MPIGSTPLLAALLLCFENALAGVLTNVTAVKCCPDGFVLGYDLDRCVSVQDVLFGAEYHEFQKGLRLRSSTAELVTCFQDINATLPTGNTTWNAIKYSITCTDIQENGTVVNRKCSDISEELTVLACKSIFTFVYMYGASMMVFANITYLCVYLPALFLYILAPEICRRAYDKVVFSYIITQVILSCIVITLGRFMLCHKLLNQTIVSLAGIMLMALTICSVLWLLVISFDVASTITKFRWAPSSGTKGRDENHKFRVYCIWVFLGTMIPVSISTILEFSPLPDDNIFKPNFYLISKLNFKVIAQVAPVPVLLALASSILFVYTTVKMIKIQKSTSIANENRKKSVKKKYCLYLQLYLLMDAPYVTGVLGSACQDLWLLKFCRVLQPLFMLYAVLPKKTIRNAFSCCKGSKKNKNSVKPKTARNAAGV